jgi:hypothetical protein
MVAVNNTSSLTSHTEVMVSAAVIAPAFDKVLADRAKAQVVAQVAKCRGTRFATFVYTNEKGETSRYNVSIARSYSNMMRASLKGAKLMRPADDLGKQARLDIIASLEERLAAHAKGEQSVNYTCKDVYESIEGAPGVKQHGETGEFYLDAVVRSKVVLVAAPAGAYKTVKSSPLVARKNELKKRLAESKYRQFKLTPEAMLEVRIGGRKVFFS